jgi:hypothetical protein
MLQMICLRAIQQFGIVTTDSLYSVQGLVQSFNRRHRVFPFMPLYTPTRARQAKMAYNIDYNISKGCMIYVIIQCRIAILSVRSTPESKTRAVYITRIIGIIKLTSLTVEIILV